MIYQRTSSTHLAINPNHQLEITDVVRNRLVNAGIVITVIFAIPVIPLTTLRALDVGWQGFMYLPIGLLFVMIVTAVLRHRLSYYLRTFIFLGSWFVLGVGCLITWGLVGMGLPFLITMGIVGVILLGYRFGIIAIVTSVIVAIIVCVGVLSGQIRFNFDINAYVISPYSWLTAILAVGVFPAIVVFGLGQLHSSLIDSIHLLSERSSELKEANEQLEEANAQCRRTEKDLIESAAFSHSLIETAPSVILHISQDNKIIDFNIEAERLYGKKRKDVVGQNYLELFVPENAKDMIVNDIKKVLGGEPTRGFENEVIAHDGTLHILSWNVNRLLSPDGQPIGIMGIGQDVTKLKETEAALRSERDRLKTLVDGLSATGIGVDIVNLNYEVLEQNQFLTERFGQPKGKKCYEYYMDSEEPCGICSMEKAVKVGHVERTELRGCDGRDYEILSSPLKNADGNVDKAIEVITDITERKWAEQALHASEEKFRTLVANIPGIVYRCKLDEHWTMSYISEMIEKVSGYPVSDFIENQVRSFASIIHPEDRQAVKEFTFEHVEKGRSLSLEYRIITSDGNTRWIFERGRGIRDENGNVIFLDGALFDVTDRKHIQQALAKSEERLSMALEAANEGLWDWNIKTQEVHFSPRYYTMLDYEADEFPPSFEAWANLIHPDKREVAIEKVYEHVKRKSEKFTDEYPMRTKTGDWRWILSRGKVVQRDENGESVRMIGTNVDITELKQTERALRQSEEFARAALNATTEMMFLTYTDGEILIANETGARSLGKTPNELVGKNVFDFFPPDVAKRRKEQGYKVIRSGKPVRFQDERAGRFFDISIYPTFNPEGKVDRLAIYVADITNRKQVEQEREKLMRTLAVKNEELESILYASSHDLKSPMVNIQGFSFELSEQCRQLQQLLKNKVSLEDENELMSIITETIPETLNFITAGSARLNSLLDGLLKVSRINRADVQIRLLDMNQIIKQIQQTITYQIKQKNISFTVEALPVCYGDHLLTGQVFANIIDNALKYLDPNRNGKIHISGRVEKNMSIYCVEDNGIGIEEDHKKVIFDLFYRLNPEDGIEGEGVGLTMVKRILQNQNGNIWLKSELGKGSRFYVSMPNSLI